MVHPFPEVDLFEANTGEPALRWGVLGPGSIASGFVPAVQQHTAQRIVAVASRSKERAEAFAKSHGIDTAYGAYEQLADDPEVDVVYIATPQSEHLAQGLLAIQAGKHVLIEKPLALSADEAGLLAKSAADHGVLLMEAMWSRYLPQAGLLRALLVEGALGEIHGVTADHGQWIPRDNRLYRPELGGGALLDLGVYPVQLDSMVLGAPTGIVARGGMTDTGVDAYATLILQHGPGVQSTLTTSLLAATPTTASIAGSEARLDFAPGFYTPTSVTLTPRDRSSEPATWTDASGIRGSEGLSWQATALARFVGEGRLESPVHTLDETASILATLGEARAQLVLS
jgi:predicted dehydrogenase